MLVEKRKDTCNISVSILDERRKIGAFVVCCVSGRDERHKHIYTHATGREKYSIVQLPLLLHPPALPSRVHPRCSSQHHCVSSKQLAQNDSGGDAFNPNRRTCTKYCRPLRYRSLRSPG